MKKNLHLILIVCLGIIGIQLKAQDIRCKLKGTVINRDSKELLLVKETEDARFNAIEIPINENKFEYELKIPVSEKYELIFSDEHSAGSWRPIAFFPENGTIEFILHDKEGYLKNKVIGGELNKKMSEFQEQRRAMFNPLIEPYYRAIDSLIESDKYYSEKAKNLYAKMKATKDRTELLLLYKEDARLENSGEKLSTEGKAVNAKLDSINRIEKRWQNDYIKENINPHSLSLIYSDLRNYEDLKSFIDLDFISNVLPLFSSKFPSHPTMRKAENMLNAIKTVKIGSKYIDFEAPTINGKSIKISEIIQGKVAFIDLWASWCGPCRASSISMISVYEKYKEKGFTIIGVACEYKNADAFKLAIERDKYPWQNLIEIDNQNKIWERYNIAGAGGRKFLVDSKGYIIAIDPTAEEVEKVLSELLN